MTSVICLLLSLFVFPAITVKAVNRFHSVDYKTRVLRYSDPNSVRKGEITARQERFAQDVYKEEIQNSEETGTLLQSREDMPLKERNTDALSPWFSFHWKNRIRESYRQANEEELTYKKPFIEAKHQVIPFNTPYRGAYNFHDGNLTGKRKLVRVLSTRNNIKPNRYYYYE